MEKYIVYILYSHKIDKYYIGQTSNLMERLRSHNNSGSKFTKKASDWIVVYNEGFNNRSQAVRRELEIKSKKSRKYIEELIRKSASA